jgi:hypothetical protein
VTRPSAHARERIELQQRLVRWLDVPLTALAFVMLALVVAQFMVPMTPNWQVRVTQGQTFIWIVFAVDFLVELLLAPSKVRYLRHNWLTALSVLLPDDAGTEEIHRAFQRVPIGIDFRFPGAAPVHRLAKIASSAPGQASTAGRAER